MTVQKDLSGVNEQVENFLKATTSESCASIELYCKKVMGLLSDLCLKVQNQPSSLEGILPNGETADFVISSMVASQLSFHPLNSLWNTR